MILPTRTLPPTTAMVTVGADILGELASSDLTVTSLWNRVRARVDERTDNPVTFDWFVLSLDMLFALGLVRIGQFGVMQRVIS